MRLKSLLFSGAAALAVSTPFAAIAGDVRGTVTDAQDTISIRAAEVRIIELNRATTTARDGTFSFADVPEGTYTICHHSPCTREIFAHHCADRRILPHTHIILVKIRLESSSCAARPCGTCV